MSESKTRTWVKGALVACIFVGWVGQVLTMSAVERIQREYDQMQVGYTDLAKFVFELDDQVDKVEKQFTALDNLVKNLSDQQLVFTEILKKFDGNQQILVRRQKQVVELIHSVNQDVYIH